jgi:hypothetical protein
MALIRSVLTTHIVRFLKSDAFGRLVQESDKVDSTLREFAERIASGLELALAKGQTEILEERIEQLPALAMTLSMQFDGRDWAILFASMRSQFGMLATVLGSGAGSTLGTMADIDPVGAGGPGVAISVDSLRIFLKRIHENPEELDARDALPQHLNDLLQVLESAVRTADLEATELLESNCAGEGVALDETPNPTGDLGANIEAANDDPPTESDGSGGEE